MRTNGSARAELPPAANRKLKRSMSLWMATALVVGNMIGSGIFLLPVGETAANVRVLADPREAVRGAHAIYTDVWVSMGDEAERRDRIETLAPYRVDAELMALAAPRAIFLHCLPAHRGEEVAAEVIDGPASAVWQQAANRLPTEQAVLYALTTGDWEA